MPRGLPSPAELFPDSEASGRIPLGTRGGSPFPTDAIGCMFGQANSARRSTEWNPRLRNDLPRRGSNVAAVCMKQNITYLMQSTKYCPSHPIGPAQVSRFRIAAEMHQLEHGYPLGIGLLLSK